MQNKSLLMNRIEWWTSVAATTIKSMAVECPKRLKWNRNIVGVADGHMYSISIHIYIHLMVYLFCFCIPFVCSASCQWCAEIDGRSLNLEKIKSHFVNLFWNFQSVTLHASCMHARMKINESASASFAEANACMCAVRVCACAHMLKIWFAHRDGNEIDLNWLGINRWLLSELKIFADESFEKCEQIGFDLCCIMPLRSCSSRVVLLPLPCRTIDRRGAGPHSTFLTSFTRDIHM